MKTWKNKYSTEGRKTTTGKRKISLVFSFPFLELKDLGVNILRLNGSAMGPVNCRFHF